MIDEKIKKLQRIRIMKNCNLNQEGCQRNCDTTCNYARLNITEKGQTKTQRRTHRIEEKQITID